MELQLWSQITIGHPVYRRESEREGGLEHLSGVVVRVGGQILSRRETLYVYLQSNMQV